MAPLFGGAMTHKQWQVFFEIHDGLSRQGPGSEASTLRALEVLKGLPDIPLILDVGCGPGAQAVLLARETGGRVVAVDNHTPFLTTLRGRACLARVGERVHPVCGDMGRMSFVDGVFDLIWSEGAIYQMGFEEGLRRLRRLLVSKGSMAVTEAVWLRADPPAECLKTWEKEYPAMTDLDGNVALIERCGYDLLEPFTLPEADWWHEYYTPLEQKLPGLYERYRGDFEALVVVDLTREEIETYRDYSDYYGYSFFVMRRSD